MTELLLVRHGLSEGNALGIVQGQMDTLLTDLGAHQAAATAARLQADFLPIDAIYSSDLERALRTASIIAERLELPVLLETGLREMHFGSHQGLSGEDWRAMYPDQHEQSREQGFDFHWPGGESRRQFAERIASAVAKIAADHQGQRVLVVTHGAWVATFLGWVADGNYFESRYRGWIGNCSISVVRLNADDNRGEIVYGPDDSHMSPDLQSPRVPDNFARK